jgi:hypothetical protein
MKDLTAQTGTLPYASELFGIYQPLLGWKSGITARRVALTQERAFSAIAEKTLNRIRAPITVHAEGEDDALAGRFLSAHFTVEGLTPTDLERGIAPTVSATIDSGVARLLRHRLTAAPPREWRDVVNTDSMTRLLEELQETLTEPDRLAKLPEVAAYVEAFVEALDPHDRQTLLRALFDKESRIAGYLIFLAEHAPSQLTALFFRGPNIDALRMFALADPLRSFGDSAFRAILSPIGVIHLYREYFFEFDSFLGPAVGHIWLSPGGTTELIEVNTRRVFTERSVELMTETTQRSESELTTQNDVAEAAKTENRNNLKFGFTNTASYTTPVFQDNATASFSLDNTKTISRETTYKHMRRQSEKLSSDIKRNFKTTFRTSTDVTDTTSKRYVIQNTTNRLVNYELRRKMRKVGVQVQDIGVQLCWHTFVDDPGRELGISKLVHMGERPDMSGLVEPEAPVHPIDELQEVSFTIPFEGLDTTDTDLAFANGSQTEVWSVGDKMNHIRADFPQGAAFPKPGYTLSHVQLEVIGADARVSERDRVSEDGSSRGGFTVHVDYVNWKGSDQFTVKAVLTWSPNEAMRGKVQSAYDASVTRFNAESTRRYKEAFITAARDRIKVASRIQPRAVEDLREEERTVVYRRLISQLMSAAPKESKHVVSELVRSIFDVDKMLYFVAPEWWVPRLHRGAQHLGEEEPSAGRPGAGAASPAAAAAVTGLSEAAVKTKSLIWHKQPMPQVERQAADAPTPAAIPSSSTVDWGGAMEYARDNYFITEDSAPAKLGSSLGWLLQLDGDNFRNAMLNAPWVKAVIPIRIGKEEEAINWLRQAHVEGNDGLDGHYIADPNDPAELQSDGHDVTVLEALTILAAKIRDFDQNSRTVVLPNPADPDDPRNHFAGSLPTEAVFESGFYPLKNGVRFDQKGTEQAIFSQWMEILPTDQIAALEVEYDPKTLQVSVATQPPREDHGEVEGRPHEGPP